MKDWIWKMRLEEVGCVELVGHPQTIHGYVADASDAEERMASGEQQTRCAECKRWRWPWAQKACAKFKADGGPQ